jgi:uncharacterized protein YndB with AHSA1/START domain
VSDVKLIVRRTIRASAERLFAAWTDPAQLRTWWGPKGVRCPRAEVDLRVGGGYRIANEMSDGSILWIVGAFERIEPPTELAYTWQLEPGDGPSERVTVRFVEGDGATEVIVLHERVADEAARDRHEHGWVGCLDGLADYLADYLADDARALSGE